MKQRGFTLLEVVVASALILVVSYTAFQTVEVVNQREKEEQLRNALLEMRSALDQFHHDNLRFPDTFSELLTAPRPLGAFYLRRLPLNPMFAEIKWEIASQTSIDGTDDHWLEIDAADDTIADGAIIDVRCPPTAGTGLNGIAYQQW